MPVPPDNYFIATLNFSINPGIPAGTYHIFLDPRAIVLDALLQEHTLVANEVTINIIAPPPPLALTTAASRKVHGSAGTFDIDLPLSGSAGVECRNSGGDHSLVFTFSNPVVSGSAAVTTGTGNLAGSPAFSGNTMTVELTGVADLQKITVTLSNVTDSFGHVLADTPVSMNVLIGDATGNRSVNASDINRIKTQVGLPVTTANFRADINASGSVSASDVAQSKLNSGHTLP